MEIELHPLAEDWDSLISPFKHTFFETSIWAKIVKQGYGCDVFLILLKNNYRILLGLPAMLLNFKIIKLLLAYYPYGNFFGDLSLISDFFKELDKVLDKYNIHRIRITEKSNNSIIVPPGYRQCLSWQHILDIQGKNEESLWAGYKKRVRRDVRRAERLGITITPVQNEEEIDKYYHLYIQTMIRNRAFRPHTKKFYNAIYHFLAKKENASFLLAKLNGRVIGGLIVILVDDTAYYLGNASDVKYLKFCPNDLLLHSGIKLALSRNLKYFDFMTTSYDDYALIHFKEKWGTKKLPFYTFEKNLSLFRSKIWDFFWRINEIKIGTYIFNKLQLLKK